ncbi:MAG TPA: hypothetical protein VLB85_10730 [Acidimicrobiia bacterium]|nr:hypothetical protein [Acidimicrobiia bacterium]
MSRFPFRHSRLMVVLSVAVIVGACSGTGTTDEPTPTSAGTSPPTESSSVPTSSALTTVPSDSVPSETLPEAEPLPTNAAAYAAAAFEAWRADDEEMLGRLLTEESLEALRNITFDPGADWEFDRCEGAAGSSYCTWTGPDGSLSFRVGNQAVAAGEEQAITEALVTGG